MAYARLFFPAGTTCLKKLKDIVKVVTGSATSISQLEFADANSSELVSYEQAGWTLADTPFEVTGVATTTEYRISAPCVNPSKTKYAALSALKLPTYITSPTNYTVIAPTSTDTTDVSLFTLLGTGIANSDLQNKSFYPKNISGLTTNAYYFPKADLACNEIYISVTNRKILVYTNSISGSHGSAFCSFASILEFPETQFAYMHNNLPVTTYSAYIPNILNTTNSIAYSSNTLIRSSANTSVYRTNSLVNWFSPNDRLRQNRTAEDGLGFHFQINSGSFSVNAMSDKPSFNLMPLIDNRITTGEGIHNYSVLTDIYYTDNGVNIDKIGLEVRNNNLSYVLLPVGSSGNYSVLAVKKA